MKQAARILLAIVALAAGAAGAGTASAETLTVKQTQSFSIFDSKIFDDAQIKSSRDQPHSGAAQVTFDPFDSSLGMLVGISARLSSSQQFDYGVRIISPPGSRLQAIEGRGGYGTFLAAAATTLGGNELPLSDPNRAHFACQSSPSVGACFDSQRLVSSFDLETALAVDAAYPGAVLIFDLPWSVKMDVGFGGPSGTTEPLPTFSAVSTITWAGQIDLTYTYVTAPAPSVPEPSVWALMIGGLGLVGHAARWKRGTPARA